MKNATRRCVANRLGTVCLFREPQQSSSNYTRVILLIASILDFLCASDQVEPCTTDSSVLLCSGKPTGDLSTETVCSAIKSFYTICSNSFLNWLRCRENRSMHSTNYDSQQPFEVFSIFPVKFRVWVRWLLQSQACERQIRSKLRTSRLLDKLRESIFA